MRALAALGGEQSSTVADVFERCGQPIMGRVNEGPCNIQTLTENGKRPRGHTKFGYHEKFWDPIKQRYCSLSTGSKPLTIVDFGFGTGQNAINLALRLNSEGYNGQVIGIYFFAQQEHIDYYMGVFADYIKLMREHNVVPGIELSLKKTILYALLKEIYRADGCNCC
jgi:hypothetical protein